MKKINITVVFLTPVLIYIIDHIDPRFTIALLAAFYLWFLIQYDDISFDEAQKNRLTASRAKRQ